MCGIWSWDALIKPAVTGDLNGLSLICSTSRLGSTEQGLYECGSLCDVWLLTAFKPHNSVFPFCPTSRHLIRKPGCSFFAVGHASPHPCYTGTTLICSKTPKPVSPLLSQATVDLFASCLHSPESLIMWARKFFIPCWCVCDIFSLDIQAKFWVGDHPVPVGCLSQDFWED